MYSITKKPERVDEVMGIYSISKKDILERYDIVELSHKICLRDKNYLLTENRRISNDLQRKVHNFIDGFIAEVAVYEQYLLRLKNMGQLKKVSKPDFSYYDSCFKAPLQDFKIKNKNDRVINVDIKVSEYYWGGWTDGHSYPELRCEDIELYDDVSKIVENNYKESLTWNITKSNNRNINVWYLLIEKIEEKGDKITYQIKWKINDITSKIVGCQPGARNKDRTYVIFDEILKML